MKWVGPKIRPKPGLLKEEQGKFAKPRWRVKEAPRPAVLGKGKIDYYFFVI